MSQRCARNEQALYIHAGGGANPSYFPRPPQNVHDFVTQEYSRACLIAFESLPKDAHREGWGRPGMPLLFPFNFTRSYKWVCFAQRTHVFHSPGTRWDGVCFRRFLLDTVPDLGMSFVPAYEIPSITIRFRRGPWCLFLFFHF
jgi:hypothetical protein